MILLPGVQAAVIDSGTTTVDMQDGFVKVHEVFSINSRGLESLNIPVPGDVTHVFAEIDRKDRACKVVNSTAECGSTKSGSHLVEIHYESREVLGNLDDRVVLKLNKGLPFKATEHKIVLKLPMGTVIPQELGKAPDFYLTPKPEDVSSDGRRIIVTWKEREVKQVAVAAVTEPLTPNDPSSLFVFILVGALVGASVVYFILRKKIVGVAPKEKKTKPKSRLKKKKSKRPSKKEVKVESEPETKVPAIEPIVPKFIENEQKVVDLLTAAPENELWQKQILQETQFSKAKLSRVIRNLEQRGVLTKTIYGNTNKISLRNGSVSEPKTVSDSAIKE